VKHTSLNVIRYGSITRHYKTCSRCLRRSANNGCRLGRYLWFRYMQASIIEKTNKYSNKGFSIHSVYLRFYNV